MRPSFTPGFLALVALASLVLARPHEAGEKGKVGERSSLTQPGALGKVGAAVVCDGDGGSGSSPSSTPTSDPDGILVVTRAASTSSTSSSSTSPSSSTSTAAAAASPSPYTLPRLALYYQTMHDSSGSPISLLPLINEQGIAMTHILISALHVTNDSASFHLNDASPSDASFDTMWSEAKTLQSNGVRVMGMVGGAAPGSFATNTLDAPDNATFEAAYAQLHSVVQARSLDGLDLDVEQSMSQSGIERLINRLKADFGSGFEVTLAPVGTALAANAKRNLSGFSYAALEADLGASVAFYNAQFYDGFGTISSTDDFDDAVANNFAADKVCVGQLTNAADGGSGYVEVNTLSQTMSTLMSKYGTVCGISGWEYFNSLPGGTEAPWQWAQNMTTILRPGQATKIRLTRREAEELTRAWERSKIAPLRAGETGVRRRGKPSMVDYFALVEES